MEPIFNETENQGIYTVSLSAIINDTSFFQKVELDLEKMQQLETERCMDLNLDQKTIATRIEVFREFKKKQAIADLHNDFNERIKNFSNE